jgi:hypothetical protein
VALTQKPETNPSGRDEKLALYAAGAGLLDSALAAIPSEAWDWKPGPARWSIREIILHIADSEANSYIRCRRFIAEPGKTVMAYDEDTWAEALKYRDQDPKIAIELFKLLRRATAALISSLPAAVWSHTVQHPENGLMTLDDWLDVYSRHVPEHINHIHATFEAWRAAAEGRPPDPGRSLFGFTGA